MSESLLQAIQLMRGIASDLKKEAALDSLKSAGIINDSQANMYAEKFANSSEEAAMLAADVLKMSSTKSASFGKAVTSSEGAVSSDSEEEYRFTNHDADLLSLDI